MTIVIENMKAFAEHCTRTMNHMEAVALRRQELSADDKKMVKLLLTFLAARYDSGQPNTIPAGFSAQLAAVLQRIVGFPVYFLRGTSANRRRGLGDAMKRRAQQFVLYLEEDVPAGVRVDTYRETGSYFAPGLRVRRPGPANQYWGDYGELRGLLQVKKPDVRNRPPSRYHTIINPEYLHLQRDGRVFGHNDIAVGAWFARQLKAVFEGAHDEHMDGIAGTPEEGAWSIVVSGGYSQFDSDEGDTLRYSGSGSKKNKDPNNFAQTKGTLALLKSINTRKPVRVLRSASSGGSTTNPLAPRYGLRYDGLYTVVRYATYLNDDGGLYARFRLVRMLGQTPLDDLKRLPPPGRASEVNAAFYAHA